MTLLAGPPVPAPQTSHHDGQDGAGAQRAALTEELASIRRWQRLVQARLDLATDLLSPAGALAALAEPTDTSPGGPTGLGDLSALVRGHACTDGYDAVDDLRAVVSARRTLAARAADVSRQLAAMGTGPVADRSRRRRCCPSN